MAVVVDCIGIVGVLLMLFAYFMSQRGSYAIDGTRYLSMNLVGSAFVVLSLFYEWNLPSFFIESAWAAISICGLLKLRQKI